MGQLPRGRVGWSKVVLLLVETLFLAGFYFWRGAREEARTPLPASRADGS